MNSIPPFDAQAYLESLMHAGQDAMKQFDDALTSATRGADRGVALVGALLLSLCADRGSPARISQTAVAVLERVVSANST